MINVILVANFKIDKTGIYTTADRMFNHLDNNNYNVFCDEMLPIGGKDSQPISEFDFDQPGKVIIFTHFECFRLKKIIKRLSFAYVHVGDWPGIYWESVKSNQNYLKGLLGLIRLNIRKRFIPLDSRLIFVSDEDTAAAVEEGYTKSQTLLLGVESPDVEPSVHLNLNEIVFTGNFGYEPNYDAAMELLKYAAKYKEYTFYFAGYNANLLKKHLLPNVFYYDSLPSIIDFLANQRRLYVSLVRFGAGAKNKILEALVSGCPVIATKQSLDKSLLNEENIYILQQKDNLMDLIDRITSLEELSKNSIELKERIENERSWKALMSKLLGILEES